MNRNLLWGVVLIPLALIGIAESFRMNSAGNVQTAPTLVLQVFKNCDMLLQTQRSMSKLGMKYQPKTCTEVDPILATQLPQSEIEYERNQVVTMRGKTVDGNWYQVDLRDANTIKVVPVDR
jgi:hypothetical protein